MNRSFLAHRATELKENKCLWTQSNTLPASLYAASLVCLFNFPLVIQNRNNEMRSCLVVFLQKYYIFTYFSSSVFKTDLWFNTIFAFKVGQGYNNYAQNLYSELSPSLESTLNTI